MENPEIKVLIDEISKLRGELIELKIEVEGLKVDVAAIKQVNKNSLVSVVGEPSNSSNNSFKVIKNNSSKNDKKSKQLQKNKKSHCEKEFIDLKDNEKVLLEKNVIEDDVEFQDSQLDFNKVKEIDKFEIKQKERKIFRDKLKNTINSEVRYDTWLKTGVNNLSYNKNGEFMFPADNDFTRGILEVRYREMVETALKEVFKNVKNVKFVALD